MSTTISTTELLARRLRLAGTYNLRDVGGYVTTDGRSVRWRTLLRGDALHQVDEDGHQLLAAYGLRTVLDLRELDEQEASPDRLQEGVVLVSIPLFSYAAPGAPAAGAATDRSSLTSLAEVYRMLIAERGATIVAAVRELLRPGALPAIVHCTAGKDRTGIVLALVLAALGVPDEIVAADFSATSLFLGEEFVRMVAARGAPAGLDEERLRRMMSADPELILAVLAQVRERHGDVPSYLSHHGLTPTELDLLRALLLEAPAGTSAAAATSSQGGTSDD